MKQILNGKINLSNFSLNGNAKIILSDEIGDDHLTATSDTPMVATAFDKGDETKFTEVEYPFRRIIETLELNLSDNSLKETPKPVAKMYMKVIFGGLNHANMPASII